MYDSRSVFISPYPSGCGIGSGGITDELVECSCPILGTVGSEQNNEVIAIDEALTDARASAGIGDVDLIVLTEESDEILRTSSFALAASDESEDLRLAEIRFATITARPLSQITRESGRLSGRKSSTFNTDPTIFSP